MSAESRLAELGINLPPTHPPVANFVHTKRVGKLLYVAGHGPVLEDGSRIQGKVGSDLTVEEAYQAARLTGMNILASVRAATGSLDRVRQVVKALGMVNSAPGFCRQPEVINGFSDLMVEVFGEAGRHARSAVGMAELPTNLPVEIEVILEVE